MAWWVPASFSRKYWVSLDRCLYLIVVERVVLRETEYEGEQTAEATTITLAEDRPKVDNVLRDYPFRGRGSRFLTKLWELNF